jgi:hypothetical protein
MPEDVRRGGEGQIFCVEWLGSYTADFSSTTLDELVKRQSKTTFGRAPCGVFATPMRRRDLNRIGRRSFI